jgi:hypothetical protein
MAVCKRFAGPGPLNSAQRMHAAIRLAIIDAEADRLNVQL